MGKGRCGRRSESKLGQQREKTGHWGQGVWCAFNQMRGGSRAPTSVASETLPQLLFLASCAGARCRATHVAAAWAGQAGGAAARGAPALAGAGGRVARGRAVEEARLQGAGVGGMVRVEVM